MKKYIICFVFLFSIIAGAFAFDIPSQIYGIWEGKDRIVFFDNNPETQKPEISIYLKPFYGWYIDRTSEPKDNKYKDLRLRNDATSPDVIPILLDFVKISKNEVFQNEEAENETVIPYAYENAFEIKLQYSKNQINYIPVAVLDNKMYLNFYIQDKKDLNLYRGNISSKGLLVSEQIIPDNIGSLYFDFVNQKFYDIRYWKTDMDYEDSQVLWQKGNTFFSVDKHLKSAGYNFSSVSGRSKKIRNPVDAFSYSENQFLFSEDKSLLIADNQPYLYKLADHKTLDQLFQIVKEQNSKRKPEDKPAFTYSELEWHKIILELLTKNPDLIYQITEWQTDMNVRESMVNGKSF